MNPHPLHRQVYAAFANTGDPADETMLEALWTVAVDHAGFDGVGFTPADVEAFRLSLWCQLVQDVHDHPALLDTPERRTGLVCHTIRATRHTLGLTPNPTN